MSAIASSRLRRGAQRPRLRLAPVRRVEHGSFGAREELVPGAEEGALPVHDQRVAVGGGQQVAQRERRLRRAHRVAPARPRAAPAAAARRPRSAPAAAVSVGPGGPGAAVPAPAAASLAGRMLRGAALEQQRALGQHQLDVLADRHLDLGVVAPARDRITPRLDREVPQPLAGRRPPRRRSGRCPRPARASAPVG